MKRTVAVLTILVVSVVTPATALAADGESEAYAGSHVAFETEQHAVVDYTVDGEETIQAVRVDSQSAVDSTIGLGGATGLAAAADIAGAAVSVDATAEAGASLQTESGARIEAHDNGRGSLVVAADGESQYVALNVSGDAETTAESDQRVVFTSDSGVESTAIVAGEGNVSVEDGTVAASLAADSRLVVRAYGDERSDADRAEERLIANGTAAASVYVMTQGNATVNDTVVYDGDTSVTVEQRTEGRVNMTVSRAEHEGRVVVAHVDETVESTGDVEVSVSGEAAARASSYAELREATRGGATSKYMVRSSGSASASAETTVLVGVNHFSTRSVTVADASTDTEGSGDDGTDASVDDDQTSDSGQSAESDQSTDSSQSSDGEGAEDSETATDSDQSTGDDQSAGGDDSADGEETGDQVDDGSADGTATADGSDESDGQSTDGDGGSDGSSSAGGPGLGIAVGILSFLSASSLLVKLHGH